MLKIAGIIFVLVCCLMAGIALRPPEMTAKILFENCITNSNGTSEAIKECREASESLSGMQTKSYKVD